MTDKLEAALARLLLAAFIIDALIIVLLSVLASEHIFQSSFWHTNLGTFGSMVESYPLIPAILLVLWLHIFFVEVVLGGRSIGRFCTGLTLRDDKGSNQICITTRWKRFATEASFLGTKNLHVSKLAPHNKSPESHVHSDWIGTPVITRTTKTRREPDPQHRPSTSKSLGSEPKGVPSGESRVVVSRGPDVGKSMSLLSGQKFHASGLFMIGRAESTNDLALANDKAVSRQHCCIRLKGKALYIIDGKPNVAEGSTYGTFVNGKKISSSSFTAFNLGDKIQIGTNVLQVE